jgi:hypothetical protein
MRDGELRQQVTQLVYRNLADRSFRDLLTASAPDGGRPLVVALPGDPMSDVLGKLDAAGRAANVVTPQANGFFVIAFTTDRGESDVDEDEPAELTAACTMGVFAARLLGDGGEARYRFRRRESGQAKLVAVGR